MSRYVIGCDVGGPEGVDAIVVLDTKTNRIVHQHTVRSGKDLALPWHLRLRMWLGGSVLMRETNDYSAEVYNRLRQHG